jgi:SAM-dependent methyltransferase
VSEFAAGYAGWYDTLYRGKDYAGECACLEALFARHVVKPRAILDLGCGTGGHSLLLARRGYRMTALDRSADMLRAARAKAEQAGVNVDFRQQDITTLDWPERFDAAIAMFAVVGYQSDDGRLQALFSGVFAALRPGGLFIFDGWHGPGVLHERPEPRLLEVPLGRDETLLRLADPRLDVLAQTVEIHYRLWQRRGATIVSESEERHLMRFFFPRELRGLLHQAGFAAVEVLPFPAIDQELQERDWHFIAVAGKAK